MIALHFWLTNPIWKIMIHKTSIDGKDETLMRKQK